MLRKRIVGQSGRKPKYYKRMSSGVALYMPLQKALEIVNKSLKQGFRVVSNAAGTDRDEVVKRKDKYGRWREVRQRTRIFDIIDDGSGVFVEDKK